MNFFMDTTLSSFQSSLPTAIKVPDSLLNVTVALRMVLFLGAVFGDVPCPQIPLDRVAGVFGEKVRKLWERVVRDEAHIDADLLLWLRFLCSFHGHRMRCINDSTGKASDVGDEQTLDWIASAVESWCLMAGSNANTGISDRGTRQRECWDDPTADLRRRLKRFLYLDREMVEYLQMLQDCSGRPGDSTYLGILYDGQQENMATDQDQDKRIEAGEMEDLSLY